MRDRWYNSVSDIAISSLPNLAATARSSGRDMMESRSIDRQSIYSTFKRRGCGKIRRISQQTYMFDCIFIYSLYIFIYVCSIWTKISRVVIVCRNFSYHKLNSNKTNIKIMFKINWKIWFLYKAICSLIYFLKSLSSSTAVYS